MTTTTQKLWAFMLAWALVLLGVGVWVSPPSSARADYTADADFYAPYWPGRNTGTGGNFEFEVRAGETLTLPRLTYYMEFDELGAVPVVPDTGSPTLSIADNHGLHVVINGDSSISVTPPAFTRLFHESYYFTVKVTYRDGSYDSLPVEIYVKPSLAAAAYQPLQVDEIYVNPGETATTPPITFRHDGKIVNVSAAGAPTLSIVYNPIGYDDDVELNPVLNADGSISVSPPADIDIKPGNDLFKRIEVKATYRDGTANSFPVSVRVIPRGDTGYAHHYGLVYTPKIVDTLVRAGRTTKLPPVTYEGPVGLTVPLGEAPTPTLSIVDDKGLHGVVNGDGSISVSPPAYTRSGSYDVSIRVASRGGSSEIVETKVWVAHNDADSYVAGLGDLNVRAGVTTKLPVSYYSVAGTDGKRPYIDSVPVVPPGGAPTLSILDDDGTNAVVNGDGSISVSPSEYAELYEHYNLRVNAVYHDGSSKELNLPVFIGSGWGDAGIYNVDVEPLYMHAGETAKLPPFKYYLRSAGNEKNPVVPADGAPTLSILNDNGLHAVMNSDGSISVSTPAHSIEKEKTVFVKVTYRDGSSDTQHAYVSWGDNVIYEPKVVDKIRVRPGELVSIPITYVNDKGVVGMPADGAPRILDTLCAGSCYFGNISEDSLNIDFSNENEIHVYPAVNSKRGSGLVQRRIIYRDGTTDELSFRIEVLDPVKPAEPTVPVVPAKPAEPVKPAEPAEPVKPVVPVKPAEPVVQAKAVAVDSGFRDVSKATQFSGEIAWMRSQGLSNGWPDGTYRPWNHVSREAIVAFFYRMVGKPAVAPGVGVFKDVPGSNQFRDAISWARETGVTKGWPDGTFRPQADIERQAFVTMLHRFCSMYESKCAKGLTGVSSGASFRDVPASNQFVNEIGWAEAAKVTSGWPDHTFRGGLPIERGAVAAMIYRATNNQVVR